MAPGYGFLVGLLLASSCLVDGSPLRALRQSTVVPAGDPTAVAVNLVRQVRTLHILSSCTSKIQRTRISLRHGNFGTNPETPKSGHLELATGAIEECYLQRRPREVERLEVGELLSLPWPARIIGQGCLVSA